MAYSKFTLSQIIKQAQLTFQVSPLFPSIEPIAISDLLTTILAEGLALISPSSSELARQNYIVAPILLELRRRNHHQIAIHAGVTFNVDRKQGLTGECDFILTLNNTVDFITSPVMTVVEAEKNDLDLGMGQCVAQMVAAQIFNQRDEQEVEAVYGCVTTGTQWQFLKLYEHKLWRDMQLYYIENVPKLMSILQAIVDAAQGQVDIGHINIH